MEGTDHYKYMRRCIDLAKNAEGMTYPNPLVGAVIVNKGRIIGEGYHRIAGGPHAEVIAAASVRERELLSSSTLYVSLEPCSHYGKTPPCTDLILNLGIPEIVAGTVDTSDKVSGKGIEILRNSGRKVISGVLNEECRRLNRRFFSFHEEKRPYITLKWAQSADGYLDHDRNSDSPAGPNWISGMAERVLVHKWRSEEQAILTGAGTIRMDNPGLNVRYWTGNDPLKVILSRSGKLNGYLTNNRTNGRIVVFSESAGNIQGVMNYSLSTDIPAANQVVKELYNMGIQSLLIEGGAAVLNHFISEGLWDEARIFTGRKNFNGGLKAPLIEGDIYSSAHFEVSDLKILLNNNK